MASTESKNVHAGHRQRLRDRCLQNGISALLPHEFLEFILTQVIRRRDVNPLAHELIATFGSLQAVLEASPEQLQQVHGVGEQTALFLNALGYLPARIASDAMNAGKYYVGNPHEAATYLHAYLRPAYLEQSALLCLDAYCRVLHVDSISMGDDTQTMVHAQTLAQLAQRHRARSVILAHNHPSGNAMPSREDVEATRILGNALALYEISLIDHIIVSDNGYYSMLAHRDVLFPDLPGLPDVSAAPSLSQGLPLPPLRGYPQLPNSGDGEDVGYAALLGKRIVYPFSGK